MHPLGIHHLLHRTLDPVVYRVQQQVALALPDRAASVSQLYSDQQTDLAPEYRYGLAVHPAPEQMALAVVLQVLPAVA
jgi:hypothetical protein